MVGDCFPLLKDPTFFVREFFIFLSENVPEDILLFPLVAATSGGWFSLGFATSQSQTGGGEGGGHTCCPRSFL